MSGSLWPARYELRLDGVLDERWSEWFEGMEISNDGRETVLTGTLTDQPVLHGVLEKCRNLGLSVISVGRLPLEERSD
ncbi:MAG TPA: hypothetical protein VE915_00545 [Actinomycetota bacterium]|nr:hypothetical protein [Actinomycetota bacterium]